MAEMMSKAHRAIEPAAIYREQVYADVGPQSDEVQTSIAISLKRIADAMTAQSPQGNVLFLLEKIAFATERTSNGV